MRFKSPTVDGFTVYAVTGTHAASFAIDFDPAKVVGLLGFSIQRDGKYVDNFKVFETLVPQPDEHTRVSSFDHPIQSFVWDIFNLDHGTTYKFRFEPFRGSPTNPDRTSNPIEITIETESEDSDEEHDVFFNAGVASSQAYARKFHNKAPDDQGSAEKNAEAFRWLARGLESAMLRFIRSAKAGDTLHCCFYEFHHTPVVEALAKAVTDGVNVRVIVDAKRNDSVDENGKPKEAFPREVNLRAIAAAKLPLANVILREARKNNLQHNKFMILHRGGGPKEVWTGSTNISPSALYGQTNVGHWIRNPNVAAQFEAYWQVLSADPGGREGQTATEVKQANKAFYAAIDNLTKVPAALDQIADGNSTLFSPRSDLEALLMYAKGLATASELGCITLPFGIVKEVRDELKNKTAASAPTFVLLEAADKNVVKLDTDQNIYEAYGSFIENPLYQWVRETNMFELGVANHVGYIHTKFLLHNPLGNDPIVISGSANFSASSTKNGSDENMLWVRGNLRVADIYFTEFHRLFFHYYFRSVVEQHGVDAKALFLDATDAWLAKYNPGTLRAKRVGAFRGMHIPPVAP